MEEHDEEEDKDKGVGLLNKPNFIFIGRFG